MMKMAANLMVFQKYFDQWDFSLKIVGDKALQIALQNWNAEKIQLMIGEEPTAFFFSRIFSKFQTAVEEADLTPTQQNLQAQQMMEMNERFGREVFPPSMIIPKLNITGKGEIIPFLQQQEQSMQATQSEATNIQHAFEEAKLQEMYSKAAMNIANARERHGRSESNIGLFEERLSMITRNREMATKTKMEALDKLVDVIQKFGEIESAMALGTIDSIDKKQANDEDDEKIDAKRTALSNEFVQQIMGQAMSGRAQQQTQPQQQAM
jgi:hypothetical protein